MHDELYNRLQQSMEDADISRREAYEESMKHRKAVKEAIEAARWVSFYLQSSFATVTVNFVCCHSNDVKSSYLDTYNFGEQC